MKRPVKAELWKKCDNINQKQKIFMLMNTLRSPKNYNVTQKWIFSSIIILKINLNFLGKDFRNYKKR